jgi:Acetyltransferase (GNAT) family
MNQSVSPSCSLLRITSLEQVPQLHDIIAACGKYMDAQYNLAHWNPPYPLSVMEDHVTSREVYAILITDQIASNETMIEFQPGRYLVGTVTLLFSPSTDVSSIVPYYTPGHFTPSHSNDDLHCYIGKLAIFPSLHKSGIGKLTLGLIEEIAKERNAKSLRCDAVNKVPGLISFYVRPKMLLHEGREISSGGFVEKGAVDYADPWGRVWPLSVLEKVL